MPNNLPSETEILRTAFGPGKECLKLDQLALLADETAPPASLAQHVKSCAYCQTELHLFRTFQAETEGVDEKSVHLVTQQLRTRQLQETSGAAMLPPRFAEERAPWWRSVFTVRWLVPASLALAALLLVAAGTIYFRQGKQPELQATNRGPEVFRSASFAVVSPVGDLQKLPGEIRWEPVQQATKYQVRLLEVDRTEVWKAETTGDHIDLPAAVRARIVPAKTLFWEITAFNSSGNRIGETGLVRFRFSQNPGSR